LDDYLINEISKNSYSTYEAYIRRILFLYLRRIIITFLITNIGNIINIKKINKLRYYEYPI